MKRLALVLALAACGGSSGGLRPGPLRYVVAPPVTLVNDRTPIAEPKKDAPGLVEYYFEEDLSAPVHRLLTIQDQPRAQNVNSLGDVPDSSWFTHRNLTAAEIEKGPGLGGPDASQPWKVVGVKVGGAAIGITMKDSRGDKYVLKFDEQNFPETESSADVVVQRLAWAWGYNVPDNQVVTFKKEQLVLDEDAKYENGAGGSRKMTDADLQKYLGMIERDGDGFRALASKYIDGTPLGGIEPRGTRDDDPNDKVAHELRRDLRGQRLLWAWVNHIDLKSANSFAAYEGDHVKWYVLDFGESLGVASRTDVIPRLGYQTRWSVKDWTLSLVTLGLYIHPWEEHHHYPAYRGLGYFDAQAFDPASWVPDHEWRPTELADKFDDLWAAEILMRFSRADLEAAVAAGKYSDARTSKYLVETLIARQRILGRYAFSRVAPLTDVSVSEASGTFSVCFTDLWLRYGFGAAAGTRYRTAVFGSDNGVLAPSSSPVTAKGYQTCLPGLPIAKTKDDYTIVRLTPERSDGSDIEPVFVHVARLPTGLAVIGLDRR